MYYLYQVGIVIAFDLLMYKYGLPHEHAYFLKWNHMQ
uniref:Uncharacterized protein n=1 Tax=Arundo donax TaxID=35708 RepID=A0A0A9H4H4_ARUDO